MRLSTRLLLIIATCLVPTIAVQVALTWNQWSERKAQLGDLVIQQAQLLAGNVDGVADSAQILLGSAAEFRQVRHRDVNCGDRLQRLLQHAPGFAFMVLIEASGRIGCASDPAFAEGQEDAPWLRAALDVKGFATGRFARAPRLPAGFLPFYIPVAANDVAGPAVLIAGLDLDWLETHLQGLKRMGRPFLASGVLTVADADGVILARDTRHAEFVGQRFPSAAMPLLAATAPGTLSLQSIDGKVRLIGYTPPTAQNRYLAAVVGVHEPELMGDIESALRRGALLLGAVTLLATLLTVFVARRFIAGPTRSLLGDGAALAGGRPGGAGAGLRPRVGVRAACRGLQRDGSGAAAPRRTSCAAMPLHWKWRSRSARARSPSPISAFAPRSTNAAARSRH